MYKSAEALLKKVHGVPLGKLVCLSAPMCLFLSTPKVFCTLISKTNHVLYYFPAPSYGPRAKSDITLEKEPSALGSNREKWLGGQRNMRIRASAGRLRDKKERRFCDALGILSFVLCKFFCKCRLL